LSFIKNINPKMSWHCHFNVKGDWKNIKILIWRREEAVCSSLNCKLHIELYMGIIKDDLGMKNKISLYYPVKVIRNGAL